MTEMRSFIFFEGVSRQDCATFDPKWGHLNFLEACPAKAAQRLVQNGVIFFLEACPAKTAQRLVKNGVILNF